MLVLIHKRIGLKFSTIILLLLLSGLGITSFYSCNIINPPEAIPVYLQVDTFNLSVSAGQGTASNKITDVWVYNETNLIGAYQMPKTFPVLDSGTTQMVFSAGIWDNGIAETRIPYPFYYPDTITMNLKPGNIIPVTPHFSYRSSTKFYFNEDFEAGNLFQQLDGDTDMTRTTVPGEVFEGVASGEIYLDAAHTYYQGITASSYSFPPGNPVYLELNYKCEQQFQVGLFGTSTSGTAFIYKWYINPKSTWGKIYLDMGSDVAALQSDTYQILIKALFDETRTESLIYLDNIKLVSF